MSSSAITPVTTGSGRLVGPPAGAAACDTPRFDAKKYGARLIALASRTLGREPGPTVYATKLAPELAPKTEILAGLARDSALLPFPENGGN